MRYIQDLGKINQITLPDGWEKEWHHDEDRETITFVQPDDKEVKLSFFYRGKPLSLRSSENLRKILVMPTHALDSAERLSIETVLRDASEVEYFDLTLLRTAMLNGQPILIAEGFWKLSDLCSFAVFISSEEDYGCRIDEIYYLAPKHKFEKYLPLFQDSLNSIQWMS